MSKNKLLIALTAGMFAATGALAAQTSSGIRRTPHGDADRLADAGGRVGHDGAVEVAQVDEAHRQPGQEDPRRDDEERRGRRGRRGQSK